MADYQLAEENGALLVSIVGYEGPRLPLLRALDEVRATVGASRDEDVEADEKDGWIRLRLRPAVGASLDPDQVRARVETTLARFEGVSI